MSALSAQAWGDVVSAVNAAEKWFDTVGLAHPECDLVVARLVELAGHPKWEVRRAVAGAAGRSRHPGFSAVLIGLQADDNGRVRSAAQKSNLRRRDWANVSVLGSEHEDRLNRVLDDLDGKSGGKARLAAKKAAEALNEVFARELYHELIKVLDPLAKSAARVVALLPSEPQSSTELEVEAKRVGVRVARLHSILEGMRGFATRSASAFEPHDLKDLLEEVISLVRDRRRVGQGKAFSISLIAEEGVVIDMDRTRMVQALMSLVQNAIEAYDNLNGDPRIELSSVKDDKVATICITDFGCGMDAKQLAEAKTLFASSKSYGTGFGLPLAIKIIESEHEGRLLLDSKKGQGTTARVSLPLRGSGGES